MHNFLRKYEVPNYQNNLGGLGGVRDQVPTNSQGANNYVPQIDLSRKKLLNKFYILAQGIAIASMS